MDVTPAGGPLWVGFDGSSSVRSLDVRSGRAAPAFPIGLNDRNGASYALDIEAIPGKPRSVVVVGDYPDSSAGTSYLFYDDGVERYGLLNTPQYILRSQNLEAGQFEVLDASRLYGVHGNSFASVDIAPTGLTATPAGVFLGEGGFWLGEQRLVTRNGLVVDTSNLQTVGDIPLDAAAEVALSEDGRSAYFVQSFTPASGRANRISCYDLSTLALKGALEFEATRPDGTSHGAVRQVARWGDSGMALLVPGGLLLVRDGAPELAACE